MAKRKNATKTNHINSATVGYEAQLRQMADNLRGSMDAAEYKHVVLDLIFLKYISDAFEEQHQKLEAESTLGADPADPDEYRVDMPEPYRGRVYDPCCGSGEMFMQSVEFIRDHASDNVNGEKAKTDIEAVKKQTVKQTLTNCHYSVP